MNRVFLNVYVMITQKSQRQDTVHVSNSMGLGTTREPTGCAAAHELPGILCNP
jgi:hypothetical protein